MFAGHGGPPWCQHAVPGLDGPGRAWSNRRKDRTKQALNSDPERLSFFQSNPDIGEMMGEAGVTEQPTPVFWRQMDTPDQF